jgi:hypothetical protein
MVLKIVGYKCFTNVCPLGWKNENWKMNNLIKVIRRTVFRNNCSKCLLYLCLDRYMFRPLSAILRWNTIYNNSPTARTETRNIRQTQASCPYGGIGVLKQVTDTNRTTKYKNQEARKYRRSFPYLHPHATLNISHQYSAGKTGRTLNNDDDNEISTFQHYMLIIYFIYTFNFYTYL